MERIVCLLVGYAFGSILTAEVVARVMVHKSAFDLGDGNPGMANVGHALGTKAALICLAGDILKTVAAVLIARALFPQLGGLCTMWAGLGSTLGHDFPFWHGFRGGKGVTTIASTIILNSPLWGILSGVIGAASIVLTGYLSMAAMIAIVFYTVVMFVTMPLEYALISLAFVALSLYGHWSKLIGISRGTTRRASLYKKFWSRFR
ncbi:MAG: glycerol-3-phosphate acyltransferase [Atopobiaceae bacterium]|nr:glycerol-3-phosphate acyltransferase [Atopobiaceae bacterium]